MNKYDVVIIGAGPAGVSCALYTSNSNKKVLVIGKNTSSLENADIRNYYGYLNFSGKELFNNGIKQLKDNNIEYLDDEIIDFEFGDSEYILTTLNKEKVSSKSVVFAIGNKKKIPSIYSKYLGRGLSVCAHCDAPLHKNKTIYYTGEEEYLEKIKEDLSMYSSDLVYIPLKKIKEIRGNDYIEEIIDIDNNSFKTNIIFYASSINPTSLLFKTGMELDMKGFIKVDNNYHTNLPNVYACGDCIDIVHQVSSAVFTGMMVGLEIIRSK